MTNETSTTYLRDPRFRAATKALREMRDARRAETEAALKAAMAASARAQEAFHADCTRIEREHEEALAGLEAAWGEIAV